MTPEDITRGIYEWLVRTGRISDLPLGTRVCTWDELVVQDPALALRWRLGVDLLLGTIGEGVPQDDDEHLNFIGRPIQAQPAPPEAEDDPEPDDRRITPDDV